VEVCLPVDIVERTTPDRAELDVLGAKEH
jgi:hypothetical protein